MKSIIIIGAGQGVSKGVAEKFGEQGFEVGLVSRNENKLKLLVDELKGKGISSHYSIADASNQNELKTAIMDLSSKLQNLEVLHYNAAALRPLDVLENDPEELIEDLKVGVVGAVTAVQELRATLSKNRGTVLLTGGGTAHNPSVDYGSISIAKTGIHNLAIQLNQKLKEESIYVGAVSINGWVSENDTKYNPKLIGQTFWDIYSQKNEIIKNY